MSDINEGGALGFHGKLYGQSPTLASKLLDLDVVLEVGKWRTQDDGTVKLELPVFGMPETTSPVFVLQSDTEEIMEEYAKLTDVESANGMLIFYASEKPTLNIPLVAKGVVASKNNAIEDLSGIVERLDGLDLKSDDLVERADETDEEIVKLNGALGNVLEETYLGDLFTSSLTLPENAKEVVFYPIISTTLLPPSRLNVNSLESIGVTDIGLYGAHVSSGNYINAKYSNKVISKNASSGFTSCKVYYR